MKQEDKETLLKDLCARLPYKVKVNEDIQGDFTLIGLTKERVFTTCEVEGCHNDFPIELIKPYLFPLSSMTEEQLYNNPIGFSQMLTIKADRDWENITINRRSYYKLVDWFNKNHFDYRGLIPMGLAIDATGKNIY